MTGNTIEYRRRYIENNREKVRQWNRDYYYRNRETLLEKQRNSYHSNPQKKKSMHSKHLQWSKNNRAKVNKFMQKYRENHKEQISVWRKKNGLKVSIFVMKLRESLFHILGNICIKCGEFDKRVLQFDHINNGHGVKDRKKFNNTDFYKYYISKPEEARKILQVLCANCNWRKRFINSELLRRAK